MSQSQKPPMKPEPVLLILALVLLTVVGLQTTSLIQEGTQLSVLQANQDAAYDQGGKIRAQLDVLANQTAKLAEGGNANAAAIIEDLKRQGITVKATK